MHVVIAGGGTIGHLSPGLAVAEVLVYRGDRVFFIGSSKGPEGPVVTSRGFDFEAISIMGRGPGRFTARNAKAGAMLIAATAKCISILRRVKPTVVLGTGGYVSLPAAIAAGFLKIPLVIHEQNAVLGFANRVAVRFANRIALGFPGSEKQIGSAALVTGNPVRPEISGMDKWSAHAQAAKEFELDPTRSTLLVFGGSQGARSLNEAALSAYAFWRDKPMQVLHLTGPKNIDWCSSRLVELAEPEDSLRWVLLPYCDRMQLAYAIADLVLCRAGASTIAEVASCGVPAVMSPLPISLDDDQRHNAEAVTDAGGGLLVPDRSLGSGVLNDLIPSVLFDKPRLDAMSKAIRKLERPRAAEAVADLLIEQAQL